MSSLLEQAIIDAGALREAAVKSAEQSIIEKYAPEVKKAVRSLLEQGMPPADPMMMDPAMGGMPPGPPMDPMMDPMMGGMPPGPPGGAPDPAALEGVPVAPLAATDGDLNHAQPPHLGCDLPNLVERELFLLIAVPPDPAHLAGEITPVRNAIMGIDRNLSGQERFADAGVVVRLQGEARCRGVAPL